MEPVAIFENIYSTDSDSPIHSIQKWLEALNTNSSTKILFCTERPSQQEAILQLLSTINYFPTIINHWDTFLNSQKRLHITTAPIQQSFQIKEQKF